jgi:hypothetical protein
MEHTFVDLDLHDGNEYYVTVMACNLAKACTSAVSSAILVDHTPPTTGKVYIFSCFYVMTWHQSSSESASRASFVTAGSISLELDDTQATGLISLLSRS